MGPAHECTWPPAARRQIVPRNRATAVWFAKQTANVACKSRHQSLDRMTDAADRKFFMNPQDIKTTVRTFILNEYLPGEDPAALTDTTTLMTTGTRDSIAVLKVVNFLEGEFGITIELHEAVLENLNTLSDMAQLVSLKKMPCDKSVAGFTFAR